MSKLCYTNLLFKIPHDLCLVWFSAQISKIGTHGMIILSYNEVQIIVFIPNRFFFFFYQSISTLGMIRTEPGMDSLKINE